MDVRPRVRSISTLSIIVCTFCFSAPSVGQVPAETRSIRDGVYTEAQADRGAKIFTQFCAGCHNTERFTGEQMKPWVGQSAYELFTKIRLTMPEDRPGGLPRQQYADILAYIFKLNGSKPGSDELTPAADVLQAITIDGL